MARQETEETSTAVALFGDKHAEVPAHLQTDAPSGNENVGTGDLATPQIILLQQLSPQIETVPDAKAGLFLNSVTNELYESLNVINLFFRKQYGVFKDRQKGQGFAGNFDSSEEAEVRRSEQDSPADWNIVDTDHHYLLVLDENGNPTSPAVLYMSGSKIRVSRDWNSQIQLKGPNASRFAGVWNLQSVGQKNGAGQAYHNVSVDFMGWAGENLYAEAKTAYDGFKQPAAPEQQAA